MIKEIQFSGYSTPYNLIAEIIQKEGAVILRDLVATSEAEELKSALIQSLEEDQNRFGDEYIFKGMVHALISRGMPFVDLIEREDLINVFRTILGHGCILHGYNSSSMPPQKSNYSRSIHVDCPRFIPGYITNLGITIALVPFTETNGAMEITPHLFNLKDMPDEDTFNREKIILNNLNTGDAILFNARCWHRGGQNLTAEWRHAVSMNVCRAFMRQQFDFPAMVGEKIIETLSESAKQFLGYFVRMPQSLEQFLLPAEKRLYRPNQE